MSEAIKPTKGEWTVVPIDGNCYEVMCDSGYYIATCHDGVRSESNAEDNARLIADAGNTYNTTGLTPSQLVERVKELEQTLRTIDGRLRQCFDDPITAREAYDSFYQEIVAAALSKARPNTAEGEATAQADSVLDDAARRWAAPKYGPKQREWCIAYETETGFDPMMDDYEAGLQTFAEAAVASLRWYEDHTRDAHLRISGKTIPGGPYDAVRAQEDGKA